jgi:hypothetical protein
MKKKGWGGGGHKFFVTFRLTVLTGLIETPRISKKIIYRLNEGPNAAEKLCLFTSINPGPTKDNHDNLKSVQTIMQHQKWCY